MVAEDFEVGLFADFLGGLACHPVQPFCLAGEGQHANAHQFLLQAAVEAGLREDGRIGVIEVLEQALLDGGDVVHRLGHETGEFLEAGEAVEFQWIEFFLAFRGVRYPRLHLGFGLNFNFAQLPAQADDVFGEVEQRCFQAAHLALDPGAGNGQFAGLAHQAVHQVGTDAQHGLLGAVAFLCLRFRERAHRGRDTLGWRRCSRIFVLRYGRGRGVAAGSSHRQFDFATLAVAEIVGGLCQGVTTGFDVVDQATAGMPFIERVLHPGFQQVGGFAQVHGAGHAGIALEGVQQAGDGLRRAGFVGSGTPGGDLLTQLSNLIAGFF